MKPEQKVLVGDELFEFDGMPQPMSVSDFWAWSMSRLIADGPRGDLAEFIVRMALGESVTIPKRGWGEYDVGYRNIGIEVKCSSLIQEWERDRPSKPVFSIRPTYASDIGENEDGSYHYVGRTDSEFRRRSDVYIFCLFANPDRSTANPLKLDQWKFYVAATKKIDDQLGDRRSATIQTLEKLGAAKCDFYGIQREVDAVIQNT